MTHTSYGDSMSFKNATNVGTEKKKKNYIIDGIIDY